MYFCIFILNIQVYIFIYKLYKLMIIIYIKDIPETEILKDKIKNDQK